MGLISDPNEFMCGVYSVEFETPTMAGAFVERYAGCPIWPIVASIGQDERVFILAIELKRQAHGDFSQIGNTLAENPRLLGAKAVKFKRDDSLLALFGEYAINTGYARTIPCGSSCEDCPRYGNPCRGCPAYYRYDINFAQ